MFEGWASGLAWNGAEYGVVRTDDRDGNLEIYFFRLDEAGQQSGDVRRITNSPELSIGPSIVWTGAEYAIAWQEWSQWWIRGR